MLDRIDQELNRREREQEKWLRSRPICFDCGGHIQDDSGYEFNYPRLNIHSWICEKCMTEHHKYL